MFYDVRVNPKRKKTVVTVRKIFEKKRKKQNTSPLEKDFVVTERKYFITEKMCLVIPSRGRFTIKVKSKFTTLKIQKGDELIIWADGSYGIRSNG